MSGGLGRYFDVDPVLFRVLFAVTSFFGGVGLIVYVLAWALIPEEGAVSPTVDRAVDELRRRKVPFWLAVAVGLLVLWTVPFHPWRPWRLGPVAVLFAAGIIGYAVWRRSPSASSGHPANPAPPFGPAATGSVGSVAPAADGTIPGPVGPDGP